MTVATLATIAERIKEFERQGASFALCADGSLNFSRGNVDMAELNAFMMEHRPTLKILIGAGNDVDVLNHYKFGEHLREQIMAEEQREAYEAPRVRKLLRERAAIVHGMDELQFKLGEAKHAIDQIDAALADERKESE